MKKALKIIGIALLSILLLVILAIFVIVLFEPVFYGDYYNDARQEFKLPGRHDGFVQQGITHTDGKFISSGYMTDKSASRLYITEVCDDDKDHAGHSHGTEYNADTYWITLALADGKDYNGHCGGVTTYGDYIYVCGSKEMLVYDKAEVLATDSEKSVKAVGAFDVHGSASFCYASGDTLYVGEFYREENYPTDASHHMTTPAGDKHHALVIAYQLSADVTFGVISENPIFAYSITDLAQGMCITASGRVVISTSYALANSHHLVYKKPSDATEDKISINGKDVPLWYLDSDNLDRDIVNPPMSEELVYVDGRVYSIGESASNKYIFGKLLRAIYVWSYELG